MKYFLTFFVCTVSLLAQQLDWDTVDWVQGSTSGSFALNGVDVKINISGGTYLLSGFPDDSNTFGALGGESLAIAFNAPSANSNDITITIDFSRPVSGVSFFLLDVDTGQGDFFNRDFRDEVSVSGQGSSGNVNPTYTPSASNTIWGGNVVGVNPSNNSSANGNVFVDFGSNHIDRVIINYGPSFGTISNPNQQGIGIGDISYNNVVIPESRAIPALLSLSTITLGVGHFFMRRRRRVSAEADHK